MTRAEPAVAGRIGAFAQYPVRQRPVAQKKGAQEFVRNHRFKLWGQIALWAGLGATTWYYLP